MHKKGKLILCLKVTIVILLIFSLASCSLASQMIKTYDVPTHRLQWWLADINWDDNRLNYSGNDVTIAIIDSGVDVNHPDLKHCIKKHIKVSNVSENNSDNDFLHGTAVSGVIAGYPSNEKGVLGIAPNCHIISIDVTDDEYGKVEVSSLVEGINIAISEKVDIISISIGILNDYDSLHKAIETAYNENIIIVAAAGNYTDTEVLYPATYEEVICAGSKSKDGSILFPKNYSGNNIVYLPGENIVTTLPGAKYGATFGTSVSAPILSGTIALMLEANPTVTQQEIYEYFSEYGTIDFNVHNCINMK